jgi:hypothetical protein
MLAFRRARRPARRREATVTPAQLIAFVGGLLLMVVAIAVGALVKSGVLKRRKPRRPARVRCGCTHLWKAHGKNGCTNCECIEKGRREQPC